MNDEPATAAAGAGLEPADELVVAEDERRPLRPRHAGAAGGARRSGGGQSRRTVAAALASMR